jgi:catechol 2,3-dioxygenase-like lactoylglutathione lyase family enzyme
MLGSSQVLTFLRTTNPAKAREFYEGTLGLHFVEEDDWALVYNLNGIMLRVQKVGGFTPPEYTSLGWWVEDITGAVKQLAAKGVAFERYEGLPQDQDGVWSVPGSTAKVAWFKDPDGNTLSLTEGKR